RRVALEEVPPLEGGAEDAAALEQEVAREEERLAGIVEREVAVGAVDERRRVRRRAPDGEALLRLLGADLRERLAPLVRHRRQLPPERCAHRDVEAGRRRLVPVAARGARL